MTEPLVVVAAVIEREGRILACRRRPGKIAGGRWEFPGGKVEHGEDPESALVREIAEELGVGIRITGLLTTDETDAGDRVIRLSCFRAELVGAGPVASTDHDRLAWLEPAALPGLAWAAPDVPAVRLLTGAQS
ncbi:(deoxy)nucleoside triphosphate pyrophosphohydrolase [Microbacter sp. GSS18]|nr:(deoxy)nucleoside triphosphate pyrophosphohydrolase [Microbacter sp. GSS18]